MINKRFVINLISNTLSYGTTVLVAFVLTPFLIQTLGKEIYSFYPLANNFVSYMSILTVALNSMSSRFIMVELIKKNKEGANTYFTSVFYGNIIMSFILGIIMLIIVRYLHMILNIPINMIETVKILFSLIFLSMLVNILTTVFGIATFIKNRLDLSSFIEIGKGILRIILYIFFFRLLKPSIVYIGIVTLIVAIFGFIVNFILNKRLLPEMSFHISYMKRRALITILSSGIWNSINQLGAVLISSISLFMSNILLGENAAGDYSIVQIVPLFLSGVISMLTSIFLPELTKKFAEGNVKLLVKDIHNSQKLIGIITNVLVAIFIAMGTDFFKLWVPGEDSIKLQNLSILSTIPMLVTGSVWTITNLFTVTNTVKMPSIVTNLCGALNIGISILLIKTTNLGTYSIAISQFIVIMIRVGFFIPIYPTLHFKIKKTTFYPIVIRTLGSAFINFYFFTFIKGYFQLNSWASILVYAIFCGILGLIISCCIILNPIDIKLLIFKSKRFHNNRSMISSVQYDIPIVLFLSDGVEKSLQVMKQLEKIKPIKLYLIGYGGKTAEDIDKIALTREQVEKSITWNCTVIKSYTEKKIRSYKMIGTGAKWVFQHEKMAIFLEDNCYPELSFFRFCKEMLIKYQNNDEVLCICGSNYLGSYETKEGTDYLFTKHLLSSAWASWSDKFLEYYDGDFSLFNKQNMSKLRKSYSSSRLYEYDMKRFINVYRRKQKGLNYLSWDTQMAITIRLHDLYVIVPAKNQIKYISEGYDSITPKNIKSTKHVMNNKYSCIETYTINFPLIHPSKITIDSKFERKLTKILLDNSIDK